MGLVAHLQHLGEDAGHVDRARARAYGGLEQRPEHLAHPAQPLEHLGSVGAVAQHLAETLVERAERTPTGAGVLQHPHPHRRGDHAGHRPDGAAVVAGLERDRGARLEERDGVLGVVDQPLEGGAAHQRAAQRAGRAVPADRRAGVQELTGLEPEHLGGRRDVDERGLDLEHRGQRAGVGVGAQRVGGHRDQVVLGAGHRRAPVDAGDRHGLGLDGGGEQVGADGDDGGGGVHQAPPPRSSTARRAAPALDRWTSAPAPASCAAWRSRSCGSCGGADQGDHDGLGHLGDGRREQGGRVGLGAVAEHDVEQQHAGGLVVGQLREVLEPQGRVDHRVGAAGGVGVVAEVGEGVPAIPSGTSVGPRRSSATIRASEQLVPPTKSPCSRWPGPPRWATAGTRTGQVGTSRPSRRSTASVAAVRSGRPGPSSASSTGVPERGDVRLDRGGDLGGRWLGDEDDQLDGLVDVEAAQGLAGGQPADLGGQVASADAERRGHADARVVEQRRAAAGSRCRTRRRCRPGPGCDDVGEAEAEAADDGGAAVGPHHQQAALGRDPLERDLLLDRHVVAEQHHVGAGVERVHRLDGRAGAGRRRPGPAPSGVARSAAAEVRGGASAPSPLRRRTGGVRRPPATGRRRRGRGRARRRPGRGVRPPCRWGSRPGRRSPCRRAPRR